MDKYMRTLDNPIAVISFFCNQYSTKVNRSALRLSADPSLRVSRFSASDGKDGVAEEDVTINICDTSGHGNCSYDLLADGYKLKHTFRIVQTNCDIGWEGKGYSVIFGWGHISFYITVIL